MLMPTNNISTYLNKRGNILLETKSTNGLNKTTKADPSHHRFLPFWLFTKVSCDRKPESFYATDGFFFLRAFSRTGTYYLCIPMLGYDEIRILSQPCATPVWIFLVKSSYLSKWMQLHPSKLDNFLNPTLSKGQWLSFARQSTWANKTRNLVVSMLLWDVALHIQLAKWSTSSSKIDMHIFEPLV